MPNRTRRQGGESGPVEVPQSTGPGTSNEVPLSNQQAQDELSAGQSNYQDAFGERIGGFLWDQISSNVNDEKIDGYLEKGGNSGADWLHEQMLANASPEDLMMIQHLRPELRSVIQGSVVSPLQQSGLGPGIEEFAANNPWVMGGLGLAGIGGYIASNPDLDGDLKRRLGENHEVGLGGEFGNLFSPSVDAVRGSYAYRDEDTRLRLQGEQRFDKDQWSLAGSFGQQTQYGLLTGHGSHVQTGSDFVGRAGLGFSNEDFRANLDGSYDSAQDLGRIQGGFATLNEQGPRYTGGFEADTRGAWNANLGVTERREDLEWFARVGAGQDARGETDFNAMAGLRVRF